MEPDPLTLFLDRLQEARADLDRAPNMRIPVLFALNAVREFLLSVDKAKSQDLGRPFDLLSCALCDLDDARVSPLLQPPKKKRGGQRASESWALLSSVTALSVEMLISSGMKESDAECKAAAALRRANIPHPRRSGLVTARTVKEWRDKISADVSRADWASQVYDDMKKSWDRPSLTGTALQNQVLVALEKTGAEYLPYVARG